MQNISHIRFVNINGLRVVRDSGFTSIKEMFSNPYSQKSVVVPRGMIFTLKRIFQAAPAGQEIMYCIFSIHDDYVCTWTIGALESHIAEKHIVLLSGSIEEIQSLAANND